MDVRDATASSSFSRTVSKDFRRLRRNCVDTISKCSLASAAQLSGVRDKPCKDHNDDLEVGWTVGGGLEFCLTQHFLLTFTYLYVDLGKSSTAVSYSETSPNGNFTVNSFAEPKARFGFTCFSLG